MPIPKLTEEQRKIALQKSLEVRKQRAELKEDIKAGKVALQQVLSKAKEDSVIGRMKVSSILQALPGVGKAKARTAMEKFGIAENRRAAGLGYNQVEKLIEHFKK